ncbi:hypothetical protein [Methylobacterium sp. J-092]|uniref:hypothetical protein n=1 Tax=Methylobacterium sp. J-092 TaxID=2836667 RepID=UPI001FB91010|nr:hypothetical protein [Methylobacterium sp. J-092]MCJ2009529.1 hypothetical protein [Methylobacterium sp. J-092]
MPSYDIAHINRQGQDIIIVPLDSAFDYKSSNEQAAIESELQRRSIAAGLRGSVVTVWNSGRSMKFRAPSSWHPFFRSIDMNYVFHNINRSLSWQNVTAGQHMLPRFRTGETNALWQVQTL